MKKILLILITFFSYALAAFASEVNVSFNESFKVETITAKKNEIINLPIYFNSSDFEMYAILGILEYDEKHLELIDYTEESGFVVTMGERLLADRFGEKMVNEGRIVTLKFKVKENKKSTLKFKDISVADLENELNLSDVEVTINSMNVNQKNTILIVSASLVIIAAIAFCIFRKKVM